MGSYLIMRVVWKLKRFNSMSSFVIFNLGSVEMLLPLETSLNNWTLVGLVHINASEWLHDECGSIHVLKSFMIFSLEKLCSVFF
jgi:hypothetical protein